MRQRVIQLTAQPIMNRTMHGLIYSWDPMLRRFSAQSGSRKLSCDLLTRITHIRISWNDQFFVTPLTAPEDPLATAAWTFGFYRKSRVATLEEALASVGSAQEMGNCEPVVIKEDTFVFVFIAWDRDGEYRVRPHRWAVGPQAKPEEITQHATLISASLKCSFT